MTTYEALSLAVAAVQVLVSVGAVAAILVGIRQMRHAGDQRAAREDARHDEAMTGASGLGRRTRKAGGPPSKRP